MAYAANDPEGKKILGLIVGIVAAKSYNCYASFMDPRNATVTTIRLVDVFVTLLGMGWVSASFP
ncbi:hypothetical protein AMK26_14060 [Streptomyces sp. CB03234]|uniref:hypothetical protein n=1 Tax=Streptomyces sp. (strain CB03234) TaxID=1703937 RepID=UPI0009688981|nr:hypothetical protein [Streptomyces sp. CB03234]OKK04471.1 hypothetical protein AMK26_14060 [Streptomyces sp. CB03234]